MHKTMPGADLNSSHGIMGIVKCADGDNKGTMKAPSWDARDIRAIGAIPSEGNIGCP